MKRELKLFWDDKTGEITDNRGNRFDLANMAEAAEVEKQYHSRGRDIEGDVTITGNLTVQDSQWVYLRGPITGSGLLANGWVTASEMYIRKNNRGDGSLRLEGDLTLLHDGTSGSKEIRVRESLRRVEELGNESHRIEGLSARVSHLEGTIHNLTQQMGRFEADKLSKELRGIRDDLNIIMSILHK